MSDNQDILKISELYGYGEADLPDSAYPICYQNIAKSQKTDAKLNQKIVSHKYFTLNTLCGGDQIYSLIFWNIKICSPAALRKKTVDWYHKILCYPGEDCTEHNLRQHFYWKGLHTTVHKVCKKLPTLQRAKTINKKYGKLPPK